MLQQDDMVVLKGSEIPLTVMNLTDFSNEGLGECAACMWRNVDGKKVYGHFPIANLTKIEVPKLNHDFGLGDVVHPVFDSTRKMIVEVMNMDNEPEWVSCGWIDNIGNPQRQRFNKRDLYKDD